MTQLENCDQRLEKGLQDAVRDDNAAAGSVREPDRVRVLEEAVQGARHLARGDPRGVRHRGARQEGRLLLPGEKSIILDTFQSLSTWYMIVFFTVMKICV